MKSGWSSIWGSIQRAFTAPKAQLKGTDRLGNQYFEVPENRLHHHLKSKRYFVPAPGQQWSSERSPEWESWLRYRREQPPSADEIEYNEQMALMKKTNASALNADRMKSNEIGGNKLSVGQPFDAKEVRQRTEFPNRPDLQQIAGGASVNK